MKKFFFFLILYSANSCFGMKQGKIILINNGLLTKFEANIAHTGYRGAWWACCCCCVGSRKVFDITDRKSTRLNSSHLGISYAVFCLKKKKNKLKKMINKKR